MTKKILILTIVVLLVVMAVPAAFAAFTSEQEAKLEAIVEEMTALKKQMIDVYVEAGEIRAEQGEQLKKNVDALVENNQNSGYFCPMGGMMGGFGGGFGPMGGMMGGFGYGSDLSSDPDTKQQSFGPNMMRTMMGF